MTKRNSPNFNSLEVLRRPDDTGLVVIAGLELCPESVSRTGRFASAILRQAAGIGISTHGIKPCEANAVADGLFDVIPEYRDTVFHGPDTGSRRVIRESLVAATRLTRSLFPDSSAGHIAVVSHSYAKELGISTSGMFTPSGIDGRPFAWQSVSEQTRLQSAA